MVVVDLMSMQESYVLAPEHVVIKLFIIFNVNRFNSIVRHTYKKIKIYSCTPGYRWIILVI